jgi:Potential Queuosine, Q, salvage protein family
VGSGWHPVRAMRLTDEVRTTAAEIAGTARWVRVDHGALDGVQPAPPPVLDPVAHYLEGSEDDVATFLLCLDTINFGSGWWPTIRKRPGMSGYFTMATGLAERFRAYGAWSAAELRAMRADELADVLGQPRDHELIALYAQALRALGRWLGDRGTLATIRAASGGSAERLAEALAAAMAMYADRGFYKRAQIVPSDLALAGVATFPDLDRLTIFADNLVPHVLRCDGVLVYDERLAAHVDAERPLRPGPQEREIRGCAVHACELIARRLGVSAQTLDHWLWQRGQAPEYKARPRHRCRTVYY